jgi:cell division septal protein FtsQ
MNGQESKKLWLIITLAALTSLIAAANIWKSSLTVKKVIVDGNRIVETNEILQLAQVTRGMKMYDMDLMVVQKDVLSHHFIKDVVVARDLPVTLKISVVERSPIALINRGGILYLDEDGFVLPHAVSREVFDLPIITGLPASAKVGIGLQLRHPSVQEALKTLNIAKLVNKQLYHLISEVSIRPGGELILYSAEEGVPILFGRGELVKKLVRLDAFWNSVVREKGPQRLHYIDVRFDEQVVVRWAPERGQPKS